MKWCSHRRINCAWHSPHHRQSSLRFVLSSCQWIVSLDENDKTWLPFFVCFPSSFSSPLSFHSFSSSRGGSKVILMESISRRAVSERAHGVRMSKIRNHFHLKLFHVQIQWGISRLAAGWTRENWIVQSIVSPRSTQVTGSLAPFHMQMIGFGGRRNDETEQICSFTSFSLLLLL